MVPVNVPWGRRVAAAVPPVVILALVTAALAVGATPARANSKQAGSSCTPASDATAAGVVSSFCFQPTSTTAGGDPDLITEIDFDYSGEDKTDTVKNMTVTLPPGLVAFPDAPVDCQPSDFGAGTCPAASQVGSGTVTAGLPGVTAFGIPAYSELFEMQAAGYR